MLVDPTVEEPWEYLDFDPGTGNIVARFDVSTNVWSPKGLKTVETLQLDRREALAAGYRKTFLRLSSLISDRLNTVGPILPGIIDELKEADDHGLLGWCFIGFGQNIQPFSDLRVRHPDVWVACIAAISVTLFLQGNNPDEKPKTRTDLDRQGHTAEAGAEDSD